MQAVTLSFPLMSWIAYDANCEFPIQNLPYGVFHLRTEGPKAARVGVAIGDYVLDLKALHEKGFFSNIAEVHKDSKPYLNRFMAMGRPVWKAVRARLQQLLSKENVELKDNLSVRSFHILALHPMADVVNLLPAKIGDYSDFYASKEHASNMGRMFRPDQEPLLPNWLWIPIGYHGRSSSVVVSGTSIRRPYGQVKPPTATVPTFQKSAKMDYELEVALFVGPGNQMGDQIKIGDAENHMFGFALLNDWSVRDVQPWEMTPLGPFTAKNLGTTISPWIVTLEALEPFRVAAPVKDPAPLPYLVDSGLSNYDIHLEVHLTTAKLSEPFKVSQSNFKYMYWSAKQQLVQHTTTGCNMNPGDMLGSGTISGPDGQLGSLIEASWNGKNPVQLPSGETRSFLQDGDTVILRGWAQGDGYRVGFGKCEGKLIAAHDS